MNSDMALDIRLVLGDTMALDINPGHPDLLTPAVAQPQAPTRPQAASKILGLFVAPSHNLGHRLQQRLQLQLEHGQRHGHWQYCSTDLSI